MAYAFGRPKMSKHEVRSAEPNQMCRKMYYLDGDVFECGSPTKGHTYCQSCADELAAGPSGRRYSITSGPAFSTPRGVRAA